MAGDSSHQRILHRERYRQLNGYYRPPTSQGKPPSGSTTGIGEAEVVPTGQLAAVLREWSRRWLLSYPPGGDYMGPLDWLQTETGIPQRTLARISREETTVTKYSLAERLLIAMDKEEMLRDGSILVGPNPYWSLEKYLKYRGGCYDLE